MKTIHKSLLALALVWLAVLTIFVAVTVREGDRAGVTIRPMTTPVLDRVLNSGTIRASYAIAAPLCTKDPNSGKLSGVGVDILEEAGRRLQLKINWVEETGWGLLFEGLNTDRYDIFGCGVWQSGSRGRAGMFTDPLFFNVVKVWGRPGETRFRSLQSLNSPDVKIAVQDGGMDALIAAADFPRATLVSMPQVSNYSEVLLNVTTGKADITFAEPTLVATFLENNPGKMVELFPNDPLRVLPTCFAIKTGAMDFKSMLDSALVEMHGDGTIGKILARYEQHPGDFYRVQLPYQSGVRRDQPMQH